MSFEKLVMQKQKKLRASGWFYNLMLDWLEISKKFTPDKVFQVYNLPIAVLRYGWGSQTKNLVLMVQLPQPAKWMDQDKLVAKVAKIINDSLESLKPKWKIANLLWRWRKKEILILGDEELREKILKEIRI